MEERCCGVSRRLAIKLLPPQPKEWSELGHPIARSGAAGAVPGGEGWGAGSAGRQVAARSDTEGRGVLPQVCDLTLQGRGLDLGISISHLLTSLSS